MNRLAAVAKRKDQTLNFAALLCELEEKTIASICRRWGASNDLRDSICWLAGHLNDWKQAAEMSLADFKRLMAHKQFSRLLALWRAGAGGKRRERNPDPPRDPPGQVDPTRNGRPLTAGDRCGLKSSRPDRRARARENPPRPLRRPVKRGNLHTTRGDGTGQENN